jgi:hypothetical protein
MTDKSKGGFEKFFDNQVGGALGVALTPAFGFPVLGLGYAFGQMAKKQHKKNADAIMSFGGNAGSMFKFNGQTVSRAPGSRVYTGNLGGLSHADMFRYEEISKHNFIPGTMQEIPGAGVRGQDTRRSISGLSGVAGVSVDGIIMDAFGTNHSAQRDESGLSMVSAGQAQRAREQEFRHMASQLGIDISGLKGRNFVDAAVDFKQFVDGKMKGQAYHGGFFHKTSNMNSETYAQALRDRKTFGKTAFENIAERYNLTIPGETIEKKPPPAAAPPAAVTPTPGDSGDSSSGGNQYSVTTDDPAYTAVDEQVYGGSDDNGGGSSGGPPGAGGSTGYDTPGYGSGGGSSLGRPSGGDSFTGAGPGGFFGLNRGGRVGMQAGGVAAQPAGFVGGPPENFTEKQTVADDRPMSVPEGTFVINAAAVEFAGSDDIKEMLSKAYAKLQKKVDKSIRVAKIPTEDEIDVAVSRGEVIVPPEIAKIIGYDRLEKINNRGKKEVTRRQKKAGGGFLAGKKLAEGGEVDYEDRIIADEVRRKMQRMLGNLSDDVTVTSEYYEDQPVAKMAGKLYKGKTVSDYQKALADAAGMVPITGRFKANPRTQEINVPQTPTLFNLFAMAEEIAHLDHLDKRRTNPYPDPEALGSFFNPSAQMNKKYSQYDRKAGAKEPFNPYEAFEMEERYNEEMRAKAIAYETVRGMLPKSKKTADFTKLGYQEGFARYVYDNAPPVIRAGLFKKYPELQQFVDDKDRFVSKKTPIINEGVKEYNRRARKVEAQRKK